MFVERIRTTKTPEEEDNSHQQNEGIFSAPPMVDHQEHLQKADEDYTSALKAHDILDATIETFQPTGDKKTDAQLLQQQLRKGFENAGLNFDKLGNRSRRKTEQFIGKILRLTVSKLEEVESDYRLDTINAMEELSEELLADVDLQDVVRRVA